MSRTARPHPSRHWATASVVIGVLAWLAFTGLSVASMAYSWSWLLSLGLIGVAWVSCRILTRDIAERRASDVDEYELAQRNQARNAGYFAALGAALVLFLTFSVAVQFAEQGDDTLLLQANQLVLAAFLPAAAGPTFLLAWRLRDAADPADDADLTEQDLHKNRP